MIKFISLIPLFPLLGFLFNGFFGKKLNKGVAGTVASMSVLASFVLSVLIFVVWNLVLRFDLRSPDFRHFLDNLAGLAPAEFLEEILSH